PSTCHEGPGLRLLPGPHGMPAGRSRIDSVQRNRPASDRPGNRLGGHDRGERPSGGFQDPTDELEASEDLPDGFLIGELGPEGLDEVSQIVRAYWRRLLLGLRRGLVLGLCRRRLRRSLAWSDKPYRRVLAPHRRGDGSIIVLDPVRTSIRGGVLVHVLE